MIIELISKCNLIDLALGNSSGVTRSYVINDSSNEKLDKIVYASSFLKNKLKFSPYIEVKYSLGRRDKRIEIVFKELSCYNLCKITKFSGFDKDCIELRTLIKDINENSLLKGFSFTGVLIFLEEYNVTLVETFIKQHAPGFKHISIQKE